MIGFHVQESQPDWLEALRHLPDGAPVKIVFGVERCREVKALNPKLKTWYRWVGSQPLPYDSFHDHARAWLANFVDGTFRREAKYVDFIQEYNETLANSQLGTEERDRWVKLHTAMAQVWNDEYRQEPELAHIRMVICETAVGNDIVVPGDVRLAQAAVQHDAVLGYHAYIHVREHVRSAHDWNDLSGRWSRMDDVCAQAGLYPDWAFGEMGVYEGATDGWRSRMCLNGSLDEYIRHLDYWLLQATGTRAYRDGRVLGGTLFTCGAPGGGPDWSSFNLGPPEMTTIAKYVAAFDYPDTHTPPPPPPPPPPAEGDRGAPREQYARVVWVAPPEFTEDEFAALARAAYRDNRRTVGFSYDDAGVGDLDDRTAVLYNIPPREQARFTAFYEQHYPGVHVVFRDWVSDQLAVNPFAFDRHGVDVSGNQGEIRWDIMAARNDVHFVYMRATAGDSRTNWYRLINGVDAYFKRNWHGAKEHGLARGAYHVWRHASPVYEQTDLLLEALDGDWGERPVALDFEDATQSISPDKVQTWLTVMEEETGMRPIIYTAPGYWNALVFGGAVPWAKDYDLWVADPDNTTQPDLPGDWDTWRIWQYNWAGNGPIYGTQSLGIDLNRVNHAA